MTHTRHIFIAITALCICANIYTPVKAMTKKQITNTEIKECTEQQSKITIKIEKPKREFAPAPTGTAAPEQIALWRGLNRWGWDNPKWLERKMREQGEFFCPCLSKSTQKVCKLSDKATVTCDKCLGKTECCCSMGSIICLAFLCCLPTPPFDGYEYAKTLRSYDDAGNIIVSVNVTTIDDVLNPKSKSD